MTQEQAALLRKARHSLQAAQHYYDFAVSRAYYAMFYVAEALLLGEDASFSRHSAVIVAFGQRFAKTGCIPARFHRYLIDGHSSRNVGDYDTGPGLSADDAATQITRAEEFLALAEQLIGQASTQEEA